MSIFPITTSTGSILCEQKVSDPPPPAPQTSIYHPSTVAIVPLVIITRSPAFAFLWTVQRHSDDAINDHNSLEN